MPGATSGPPVPAASNSVSGLAQQFEQLSVKGGANASASADSSLTMLAQLQAPVSQCPQARWDQYGAILWQSLRVS